MRQSSAESREIDLMMRQWKPAKQTPAITGRWVRGNSNSTLRGGLRVFYFVLLFVLAAGAGLGSTTALAQAPVRTRTTLAVSVTQSGMRSEWVLTAHVTDAAGQAVTGEPGTVSFETGKACLGSAIVDGEGDATLTVSSLPGESGGARLPVRAIYHPFLAADGTVGQSSSVSAAAMVEPDASGVPDFSAVATPTTLTTPAGQYATSTVTITPTNGFSEQVTLSCEGLPAQAVCNFSPVIASTANGAFTSTLQIQTQAPSGALAPPDFGIRRGPQVAFGWVLPGVLALTGLASLRRRSLGGSLRSVGLLLLLGVGGIGLGGCSSRYYYNHHPPSVATGTPTGTYAITLYASGNNGSSVTSHTVALTLEVQ